MPLNALNQETGWLSRWAFQAGALSAEAIGRQAIADGYFSADAAMRAKIADEFITAVKLAQPTVEGVAGIGFRVCRASYAFAVDGGLVSTIPLLGATSLPANALIVGGLLNVTAALTSLGAATAALQVEAANDIVVEAAIAGAPWSTIGRKSIVPSFDGANTLLTTVARDVSLVIGTADLTGGAFSVFLFYVVVA